MSHFMFFRTIIFTFIFLIPMSLMAQPIPSWVAKVGARSNLQHKVVFMVNTFGATGHDSISDTKSIQAAIDACAVKGGGIVRFQPGTYIMGAIFLKSNVHLQIDSSVLILGAQDFAEYPEINTRIAGIEMEWPAALINVIDAKNVKISGKGIVNARGKFCWDKYWTMRKEYDKKGLRWIVDYDAKRVRTLLMQNAEDVTLEGLTFKNAGFWTVQVLYSTYVTVRGLIIRNNEDGTGPSTDGVNIDSSTWILVEDCDVDCNDDNFCLKSGRDWDGLRVNRPTEYVVIRNCLARRGAGLITLGSETSGGLRHIYATGLKAKHTDNGLRIKSATTRGGTIEDIYFVNSVLDSVRNAYQFNLNWYPSYSYSKLPDGYTWETVPKHWKTMLEKVTPESKGIPYAKDMYIQNVRITNAEKAFEVNGLSRSIIQNVQFKRSTLTAQTLGSMEYAENWDLAGLKLSISTKPVVQKKVGNIAEEERLK